MIKKIILIFACLTFLFACGKKEDPEYKAKKNYILNNKV
jgi:hypothetical protein|tara:strand:+ start:344 stop:460 length:117 start_codon:yes stop_codon:yes gene_type:complete